MAMNEIATLQQMIDESRKVVFFGGAGVSTESNIPDFRSSDGLYQQKYKYPPEQVVSHTFFVHHTEEFYEFYKERMMFLEARPNKAHLKLAQLEAAGKVTAVITRILMGYIRWQVVKMCWSCTAVFTAIIAKSAENFMMQLI